MDLVVGLGNPGGEYERTRHNVGFDILDLVASRHKVSFRPGKGDFWYARMERFGTGAILVKPTTFMNNSGRAVVQASELFGIPVGQSLIVYDDLNLPLGTIRYRPGGTDGGHNGMASVIYDAGSFAIPRLRCGIAPADTAREAGSMTMFVLSVFDRSERAGADEMIGRAAESIDVYLVDGIGAAMNTFNNIPPTQHRTGKS